MGAHKNWRNKRPKNKPFAAIEIKTVMSDQWKELSRLHRHLYNMLKTFYKGNNESFKAPFDQLRVRSGIKHGTTIDTGLRVLEQREWIEVIRYAKHGTGRGLRVRANEYRLTGKYDYLRF